MDVMYLGSHSGPLAPGWGCWILKITNPKKIQTDPGNAASCFLDSTAEQTAGNVFFATGAISIYILWGVLMIKLCMAPLPPVLRLDPPGTQLDVRANHPFLESKH